MPNSPFESGQPGYGETAKRFMEEGAAASQAAMERREAGLKRVMELQRRRRELRENLDAMTVEMEALIEKWGIEEREVEETEQKPS